MARKISIGVNWAGDFNIDDIVEQAKIADEAGVHALNIAEAWGPDALTLLTVVARETKNIQLGTSIINTYSRSPGAMAQHFATMDHISNGRMFIGLGSSGPNVIEHFHGIKFGKPLTRIKEYTEIINMIMRQEPLNYEGKIFNLSRGFTMRFKPLRDHIPIHIASITPKSLEQTATIADGWIPIFLPKEQWETQLKDFYGYVEAAGRSRDDVTVRNATGVTVTDDPERARMATAGGAAFYIARMGDFYYDHFSRMGYADEANAVRRAWADGGSAAGAAALPKELAEQLGTAGSVDECIDAMEQAEAAGFDWHSVTVNERDPKKRAAIYERLVG
jgi:F420-dependent oxidoreductase-like protein